MNLINKYKLTLTGIIIGAIGGYLYYYFIGCAGNVCPISSNPYISTVYGGIVGALLIPRSKNEARIKDGQQ